MIVRRTAMGLIRKCGLGLAGVLDARPGGSIFADRDVELGRAPSLGNSAATDSSMTVEARQPLQETWRRLVNTMRPSTGRLGVLRDGLDARDAIVEPDLRVHEGAAGSRRSSESQAVHLVAAEHVCRRCRACRSPTTPRLGEQHEVEMEIARRWPSARATLRRKSAAPLVDAPTDAARIAAPDHVTAAAEKIRGTRRPRRAEHDHHELDLGEARTVDSC